MVARVRRFVRYQGARLRAFGKRRRSRRLRSIIWSWEYRTGRWSYLESAEDPELFDTIVRYADGGSILDLGCGNGVVRCGLPAGAVSRYVGIDLSRDAIRRTYERSSKLAPLAGGEQLIVGDIADADVTSRIDGSFNVVLLQECLYYIKVESVPAVLTRFASKLRPAGVIIVKIHDSARYGAHVEAVKRWGHLIDDRPSEPPGVLMVLQP